MSTAPSQAPPIAASATPGPQFDVSPVPNNPLGERKYIKTAAALVIGDEILNGKTLDRNSNYFARFCFERGIDLKRIEVIADEESEIVEASRRMVEKYDFVITSGGIGPTHDDITYQSLARAFNQSLKHDQETLKRMEALAVRRPSNAQTEEQKVARQRMALFPEHAEILFIAPDIWVPVVRLEGKLCIFPGIPTLFQRLLDGLSPYLPIPPEHERPMRMQIFTPLPESQIAPFLTTLQKRLSPDGIRIGSYPVLQHGVYVSLIGPRGTTASGVDGEDRLRKAAEEVEREIQGKVVTDEEARQRKGTQS